MSHFKASALSCWNVWGQSNDSSWSLICSASPDRTHHIELHHSILYGLHVWRTQSCICWHAGNLEFWVQIVHVQRLVPDQAAQSKCWVVWQTHPKHYKSKVWEGQLTHVPNLHVSKRDCPSLPDDMPSLHRSKETVRGKQRKSSKVNENITHKPEGVPTPLSIQKHHLLIQLQRDQLQPDRPTGVVCRPHALPGSNYQAVELHQHTFGLTHASDPATQSRCRGQQ